MLPFIRRSLFAICCRFWLGRSLALPISHVPCPLSHVPFKNEDFAPHGAPTDGNDACRIVVSREQIWTSVVDKPRRYRFIRQSLLAIRYRFWLGRSLALPIFHVPYPLSHVPFKNEDFAPYGAPADGEQ